MKIVKIVSDNGNEFVFATDALGYEFLFSQFFCTYKVFTYRGF